MPSVSPSGSAPPFLFRAVGSKALLKPNLAASFKRVEAPATVDCPAPNSKSPFSGAARRCGRCRRQRPGRTRVCISARPRYSDRLGDEKPASGFHHRRTMARRPIPSDDGSPGVASADGVSRDCISTSIARPSRPAKRRRPSRPGHGRPETGRGSGLPADLHRPFQRRRSRRSRHGVLDRAQDGRWPRSPSK